jgi:hypothetical protein
VAVSDPLLSPRDLALVDAVAERVLELLAERGAPAGRSRLVSAAELAEVLGVTRDTVYCHADELSAVRLGARGRLRFDVEKAIAAWTACEASSRSQPADAPARAGRSRRRRAPGSEGERLPNGAPPMRIGAKTSGRSPKARTP